MVSKSESDLQSWTSFRNYDCDDDDKDDDDDFVGNKDHDSSEQQMTYETKEADTVGASAKATHEANGNDNASNGQQKIAKEVGYTAMQCKNKDQGITIHVNPNSCSNDDKT